MLRRACFFVVAFGLSQITLPAEYATTDDGRRVLLNEDGTWQFIESQPAPSSTHDEYPGAEKIITVQCQREWKDDFSMRAYCEKKQRQAISELSAGRPSDIGQGEFAKVRAMCAEEWPRDFAMRRYCETKQYQAIRELRR